MKRVGLVLAVKCVFVRILDRVLGTVVDFAKRGRQVRSLQLGEGIGHKYGLHELLSHADVENVRACFLRPISMMPRFSLKLTLARLRTGIERAGSLLRCAAVMTTSATPTSFFPLLRYF